MTNSTWWQVHWHETLANYRHKVIVARSGLYDRIAMIEPWLPLVAASLYAAVNRLEMRITQFYTNNEPGEFWRTFESDALKVENAIAQAEYDAGVSRAEAQAAHVRQQNYKAYAIV